MSSPENPSRSWEAWPTEQPALPSGLEPWVAWYVQAYEAWDTIPACWARHPAMIQELHAAMQLRLAIDTETAGDLLATARGIAEWHDYRSRFMDRLARTPGATCAQRRSHREPTTWDRHHDAQRRRERSDPELGRGVVVPGGVDPNVGADAGE
ncbi:hypothetical protein ACFFRE_02120 [Aciditerrimonas ferrireducens]|uniref:Uncharacterized protein n=1 Tax=Aciditerrimonas ferrireducens TaxID=667306 RepID=A0ABV6C3T4_9ACTN